MIILNGLARLVSETHQHFVAHLVISIVGSQYVIFGYVSGVVSEGLAGASELGFGLLGARDHYVLRQLA